MSVQTEFSHIASRGMVVTPHHLASQSALAILRDGGTAMEATVAAAATISVVYPHMNSIGGDGVWLIVPPHEDPFVIEACGVAGSLATEKYLCGYKEIPRTGPKSALTVAGTISGWQEALNYVSECGYHRYSLHKLLADAIYYAKKGFPVSSSHEFNLKMFLDTEIPSTAFKDVFLPKGKVPNVGEIICQPNLAKTLRNLAEDGLSSFYKGKIAKLIEQDMRSLGMAITMEDLENNCAIRKSPLHLNHEYGKLFNTPPPTQGIASLAILGILDKLKVEGKHEGVFIHTTVEATKQAFALRDEHITDPRFMKVAPDFLLQPNNISKMTNGVDLNKALFETKRGKGPGDTVWIGVMDNKGFSVSFIQSVYQNFGSGVVLPQTGVLWHNRGVSFELHKDHLLYLKPGKKPLHTLNCAAAVLKDGRTMVYGTRGADGQPQTQAAIFHRYVIQDLNLQKSISMPRWLYGDTVDKNVINLVSVENRFSDETIRYLRERGHVLKLLPAYSEKMGHAGALVRHPDGRLEGAYDPRGNGSAVGF